uniref:Heparan sulfate 2-O-sulfotransferase pipe n=1 Tax=Timema genevievae TaxID=629358 RepID=A0A7R9K625_TIMGE|nr:unnamed protein product [Timema genevievae]
MMGRSGFDPVRLETLDATVLNNTIKAGIEVVFFNRVPKVGSQTFMELIRRLSLRNQFGFHRDHIQRVETIRLAPSDQVNLALHVNSYTPPAVYVKHVCFTNFTQYGMPEPIYVNLVRDPVERVISWYYYVRAPWYYVERKQAFPDIALPDPLWLKKDFETCVLRGDRECRYLEGETHEGIGDHRRQSLFFCGHSDACTPFNTVGALQSRVRCSNLSPNLVTDHSTQWEPCRVVRCSNLSPNLVTDRSTQWEPCRVEPFNTVGALQRAKHAVERHYAVVGILEDLNSTLTVLEHYVPRFFKGASQVYWASSEGAANKDMEIEANKLVMCYPEDIDDSFNILLLLASSEGAANKDMKIEANKLVMCYPEDIYDSFVNDCLHFKAYVGPENNTRALILHKNEVDRFTRINRNMFKPPVREEVKDLVRRNFTREVEFYEFCRQRLHRQFLALRLQGA